MYRSLFFSILILGIIGLSCSKEDENTIGPTGHHKIDLSFQNLTMLQNGYHYEGWAIINGTPVSTGKFNVDASGSIVDLNGNAIMNGEFETSEDLTDATAIVITIEPDNDTDPGPADTHYLAGDVSGLNAGLSVGHSAALNNNFSSAAGEYILATPTNGSGTNENSGIWFLKPPSTTFTFNFSGLQPLQNGYHYEGWAIVSGSPVSTGKFNVDASGNLVDLNGTMIPNGEFQVGGDLSAATAIVLTIEPAGDMDPAPAATHYLAGDVTNDMADLDVAHAAALGDDFMGASGKYILATPTNGSGTNENSGIWFLDLSSGTPAVGLQIPILPAGWQYEGWSVINGTPVTTGKFTDPAMTDLAAPYSGQLSGPPFPGEDFLNNSPAGLTFPTDLAGMTAVISIEPDPDDDAAPFTLKPLASMIPSDAMDHVTYDLDNNAGTFPTGTVSINFTGPMEALSLPSLPAGWDYEGWVVINGTPVTSGKFSAADMADDSAPYSSTMPAPPFPGEDFLLNAPMGLTFPTDLAGMTAVISIEPMPDDDPAPFALKPLKGMIPADATDHVLYMLDNDVTGFPSGDAEIK